MSVGTSRLGIALPAAGVFTEIKLSGTSIVVELSPDNTPGAVPLIHIDSQGGSVFPAYTGSQFKFKTAFKRFFVEGTAASGTLYLLILNGIEATVDFPTTSTA